MSVPSNKKELQAFLGIIDYLGKFFSRDSWYVWPTAQADIQLGDLDMECILPVTI